MPAQPTWRNLTQSSRFPTTTAGGQSACLSQALRQEGGVTPCGPAELLWRKARSAAERAHEVGEIAEPNIERDVADRERFLGKQPCRTLQPAANQILMRGHAEDLGEGAQEVKRTDTGDPRDPVEIDLLVGMHVDPGGRVDCTSAVGGRSTRDVRGSIRQYLPEAGYEQESHFMTPHVGLTADGGLG